jgi:deoxyribodipyrimidine photo-lyase
MSAPVVVWFRHNLRLADNPALAAAAESGHPVLPVYVHGERDTGAASDWWLHHSLVALSAELSGLGTKLIVLRGSPASILPRLANVAQADTLYYSRDYSPQARAEQDAVTAEWATDSQAFDDTYLHAPGSVLTQDGHPYKVFTPFWKACLQYPEPPRPVAAPDGLKPGSRKLLAQIADALPVVSIDDLGLLPTKPDWADGLRDAWHPGEDGAHLRLD